MSTAEFLARVERLCYDHSGSVISWVRSAAHNQRVGGHPRSRHLDGRACDGRCETHAEREALMAAAYRVGLRGYRRGRLFWHLQADKPRS